MPAVVTANHIGAGVVEGAPDTTGIEQRAALRLRVELLPASREPQVCARRIDQEPARTALALDAAPVCLDRHDQAGDAESVPGRVRRRCPQDPIDEHGGSGVRRQRPPPPGPLAVALLQLPSTASSGRSSTRLTTGDV